MLAGTYVGGFVRVYINYRVREPPLCSQSIARLRDLRSGDWRGTRKLGGEETRKLLGEEVWGWDWKGRGRGGRGEEGRREERKRHEVDVSALAFLL